MATDPHSRQGAGMKYDGDKPRMELLVQGLPRALEAIGGVLTFGAKKYRAHSWKQVEGARDRYWGAKIRHELSRAKGEQDDPESGLLHLAHEACSLLFLLELELEFREVNGNRTEHKSPDTREDAGHSAQDSLVDAAWFPQGEPFDPPTYRPSPMFGPQNRGGDDD